ncbi:MAG: hypothetical protein NWQ19_08940, partial [Nonlabens sp.]|nr:hypothetical protein [Nonlabens sp.]
MKQFNITLVLLTLGFTLCNGQDISLKRTNTLFSNQAYVEAAASYEQHARTQEVLTNLGDAYYFIGNLAMAEKTYSELTVTHGTIQNRDRIYRYAQSLLAAKKYKQADEFLGYYHGRYYNTEAFKTALTSSKTYNYNQVEALKNEGTFSDFGMRFVGADQIVFASSRNK